MGDRATVGAGEHPLLLEQLEVASDGRGRDAESIDERRHVDGAVGREGLQDRRQPLRLSHAGREHTPAMRDSGRACLDRMSVPGLVSLEMSAIAQEVATQPTCWRRGRGGGAGGSEMSSANPARDGRRSSDAAPLSTWPAPSRLSEKRAARGRPTPSRRPSSRARADTTASSRSARSGTTTEVIQLLERLDGVPRTAHHGRTRDRPRRRVADASIVLGFADERSVVQTRFATSVLALVRAHLGEDLAPAISTASARSSNHSRSSPPRFDHVVFLGHGWTVAIAEEAALKLREATRTYSEAYPAMEYRHGPISLAGERSLVWVLGSPDPTLADDARATGATVRVASLDPMAELVLVHRVAIARRRGQGPRSRSPRPPDALGRAPVILSSSPWPRSPQRRCSM